jgi:hypothetical protein
MSPSLVSRKFTSYNPRLQLQTSLTLAFALPVNQLFSSLFADALGKQIYAEQTYWKHVLNEKYQIFSGNYHNLKEGEQPFKYEVYVGEPPRLRLAPPQTTQAVSSNQSFVCHII